MYKKGTTHNTGRVRAVKKGKRGLIAVAKSSIVLKTFG